MRILRNTILTVSILLLLASLAMDFRSTFAADALYFWRAAEAKATSGVIYSHDGVIGLFTPCERLWPYGPSPRVLDESPTVGIKAHFVRGALYCPDRDYFNPASAPTLSPHFEFDRRSATSNPNIWPWALRIEVPYWAFAILFAVFPTFMAVRARYRGCGVRLPLAPVMYRASRAIALTSATILIVFLITWIFSYHRWMSLIHEKTEGPLALQRRIGRKSLSAVSGIAVFGPKSPIPRCSAKRAAMNCPTPTASAPVAKSKRAILIKPINRFFRRAVYPSLWTSASTLRPNVNAK